MNKTVSCREANQNFSKLTRVVKDGPVVITDRGRKAYVLMTHEEYERISPMPMTETLFDLIGQYGPEHDFDFDPPRRGGSLLRPIEVD